MLKKRVAPEEIIGKLRHADEVLGQRKMVFHAMGCLEIWSPSSQSPAGHYFQVLTLYPNGGDRLLLSELILQLVQPGVDALPG